ncbi:MAG: hypothetical protein J5988_03515 [Eubacterium sp.]|nr:hypothetical protein [Eubacterium sp.]
MEKNLYRIINSILLAHIGLLCMGEHIGIGQVAWYHVALTCFVIFVLALFCYLKLRGRLLLVVSLAACAGVSLFVSGWEKVRMFGESYISGIWGNGEAISEWGISQECVQVVGITIGVFLFQLLAEKLFGLKIVLAALFIGMLCLDLFIFKKMEHITVVCILTYMVIVYVEGTRRHWKKHRETQKKLYIVWLLPFIGFYFFLMLVMPAPQEPYDWQFVKDAYSWLKESFVTISQEMINGEREDFEIAAGGFSEDGRLLGGITDSNQEIMRIQGQRSLKTNVYLVGKVYDSFGGQQWTQYNESTAEDRLLDALETAYAIRMYDKEMEANYIHSTKLSITYQYFNTGYVFAPLKTWKVESTLPYENSGGNLIFKEKMSYGTAYDARFLQINVDHALFYELLDAKRQQDENVWRSLQKEYGLKGEDRYSLKELEQHREKIYEIYGQVPSLSEETGEWLKEATDGAQTDVEKLKAIESALSKMEYTMTPGKLPEEIASEGEFLDYFLLESKKGFCSYFATAFVILARAEGIPARYVEGFCVPLMGEGETVVYSHMAHAWPEVYIDGVGWIPFEPTPGYESIRYTPWEMVDYKNHYDGGVALWEDLEEENIDNVENNGEEDGEKENEELKSAELEGNAKGWFIWKIVLFSIVFTVLLGAFILTLDNLLAKRCYRKWSLEQKVMAQLKRNLLLLERLGYKRAESETLEELGKRAWAVMNYERDGQEISLEFLKLYEDVFYGNHTVTEEMLLHICQEQEYLMEMLKKWRRLVYIYCKFGFRGIS